MAISGADRRRVAKAKDVDALGFQEQPGRRIESAIIEEAQRILQSFGNIGKDLGRATSRPLSPVWMSWKAFAALPIIPQPA